MKKALSISILVLLSWYTFAQTKGDTLYVATHSGLNLRTEPGTKSTKITAIPKEGMVVILADLDSSQAFTVTEFPGFKIKGFWVEVDYKGQAGYVFSGYLSGFKPNLFTHGESETSIAPDYEYLLRHFAPTGPLKNVKHYSYCDTCICGWERSFGNGMEYTTWSACEDDKGQTSTIVFEDYSLQQVYLFFLNVYDPVRGGNDTTFWNSKTKRIESRPKEQVPGCYYEIFKEEEKVVLKYFCGC